MKNIIIHVQSFVDIITNSSTEIYVTATQKTIESIKEIINQLLILEGSKWNFDDLFTISLEYDNDDDQNICLKSKEINNKYINKVAELFNNLVYTYDKDAYHNY